MLISTRQRFVRPKFELLIGKTIMFEKFYAKLNEIDSPNVLDVEPFTLDRKIERVSRVKPSILGYGHKGRSQNYLESTPEFDTFLAIEFDENVKAYLTQPASFYINVDGRKVRHTPDMLLMFNNEDLVFIQIKPSDIAYSPEYQRKFKQYQRFFMKHIGIPYELVTELELGGKQATVNRQQLYRFLDIHISPYAKKSILKKLPSTFTVAELENACKQKGKDEIFAWALIAQGHVEYTPTELLTRQSVVIAA